MVEVQIKIELVPSNWANLT